MCELCGGAADPKRRLTRRQILNLSVSLAAGMALGLAHCDQNLAPPKNAPETQAKTTPATHPTTVQTAPAAAATSAPDMSQTQPSQALTNVPPPAEPPTTTTQPAPDLGAELFPDAQGRPLAKASDAPVIIVPRTDWTKAGPNMGQIVPMNGVRRLTVHHTAGATLTDAWAPTAGELEAIREYHAGNVGVGRNWADIAYHFAVDRAGRVWQARPLAYQGAHARQHNEHNMGIVLLGNFEVQMPSAAQLTALAGFIGFVRKVYGIPLGEIYTHGELVDTSCPGKLLQEYMDRARGEWAKAG